MNVERPFEISTEREKYQRILPVSLSQKVLRSQNDKEPYPLDYFLRLVSVNLSTQ